MKYSLLLLYLFLAAMTGRSQGVAIVNESNDHVLYPCINRLRVVACGCAADAIVVSCDNGKMEKDEYDRPGYYSIVPMEKKMTEVIVRCKTATGSKIIGKTLFGVHDIQEPVPMLNRQRSGSIHAAVARVQIAPSAELQDWRCGCGKFQITGFTLIVIRKEQVVSMTSVVNTHGARFSDNSEMQSAIAGLQAGDKLVFTRIDCIGPDGKIRHLSPMEFTID